MTQPTPTSRPSTRPSDRSPCKWRPCQASVCVSVTALAVPPLHAGSRHTARFTEACGGSTQLAGSTGTLPLTQQSWCRRALMVSSAPCCLMHAGVVCRRVSRPISSVGLYVPGGTAVLPSSALMLAVPAAIAGCKTIVLATPPRPDGSITPEVGVCVSVYVCVLVCVCVCMCVCFTST